MSKQIMNETAMKTIWAFYGMQITSIVYKNQGKSFNRYPIWLTQTQSYSQFVNRKFTRSTTLGNYVGQTHECNIAQKYLAR